MMRTGKGGVVKRNQLNVVFRDNGISGQAFVLQKNNSQLWSNILFWLTGLDAAHQSHIVPFDTHEERYFKVKKVRQLYYKIT